MNFKKLSQNLIASGIFILLLSINWWVSFYERIAHQFGAELLDFKSCLLTSNLACNAVGTLSGFSNSNIWPYSPALFWLGGLLLFIGFLLKNSLNNEIVISNKKLDQFIPNKEVNPKTSNESKESKESNESNESNESKIKNNTTLNNQTKKLGYIVFSIFFILIIITSIYIYLQPVYLLSEYKAAKKGNIVNFIDHKSCISGFERNSIKFEGIKLVKGRDIWSNGRSFMELGHSEDAFKFIISKDRYYLATYNNNGDILTLSIFNLGGNLMTAYQREFASQVMFDICVKYYNR